MNFLYWTHAFWIAELGLEFLLIVFLLSRTTIWQRFPVFLAFSSWSMVGDSAGRYIFLYHGRYYPYAYSVYEFVSIGLALALTYEIFVHLFTSHRALQRLASITLGLTSALLSLLGIITVLSHGPIGQRGLIAGVLAMEEAGRVIEVGLILALFVCSSAFGLHWRRQIFGIALGLGFSASVKLAVVTIIPRLSAPGWNMTFVVVLAYDLSLLIWIAYALLPERVSQQSEVPDRSQLEQWNRAVMELIHQ